MVEITQAAREAAAAFCERMGHARTDPDFPQKVRQGKRDRWVYVKAFAAIREAARNEALEEAAKVAENWPDRIEGGGIAAAIRNLKIGEE